MDLSQLNPLELIQLQSLVNRMQNGQGSATGNVVAATANRPVVPATTASANHPVMAATHPPDDPLPNPFVTQPTSTPPPGPILPYQSIRVSQSLPTAPQGHPSPTVAVLATPMQPFLGRNSLAVGMAGQVNQQRRASAAAHLPRRPATATRGGRNLGRGPAIPAPTLACPPTIQDCLFSIPDEHWGISAAIRIKIKVYPPQVSKFAAVVIF